MTEKLHDSYKKYATIILWLLTIPLIFILPFVGMVFDDPRSDFSVLVNRFLIFSPFIIAVIGWIIYFKKQYRITFFIVFGYIAIVLLILFGLQTFKWIGGH